MNDASSCPVCGQTQVEEGDYGICEICGWENDPVQLADPAVGGGANILSLNEARASWRATGKQVK